MLSGLTDALKFSAGGDMGLGDTSSATSGDISMGSISNAGTVTDKSWLLNTGTTDTGKVAYYGGYIAAGVIALGVVVWAIKGRK
jgi:hypothetical protein